jgi:type I restriction enzyme S subunit
MTWREVPIGELCIGIFDGPHATPHKTEAGPVFLGISNLNRGRIDLSAVEHVSEEEFVQRTRRVMPEPGDLVFSYETRLGEAALIPASLRCCLGRRIALLRPDPRIADPRFLLYAYLGPQFQGVLRSRAVHGSTVNRIPLIDFPGFPMRVPALSEQRAVARVLGSLDDKIELHRRMNETLEEMARALFKSWFVDFAPVRAKMNGREPTGMDREAAKHFPKSFEDSPLGAIPRGWRAGVLNDIATIVMGSSPPGGTYNDCRMGTPLVNGPVEFGDYFAAKKKWTTLPTALSKVGDLIFCVRGSTTGRRVVADDAYCLGRGVCAIRARGPTQEFVDLAVDVSLPKMLEKTTGSVFPNLTKQDIEQFRLLLPPRSLIVKFCDQVRAGRQRRWRAVMEMKTLAELRDELLPELMGPPRSR